MSSLLLMREFYRLGRWLGASRRDAARVALGAWLVGIPELEEDDLLPVQPEYAEAQREVAADQ